MKNADVIRHLNDAAHHVAVQTGQPANVIRLSPILRERVARALLAEAATGLEPVLLAMRRRERKRANRRKRAARIRRHGR